MAAIEYRRGTAAVVDDYSVDIAIEMYPNMPIHLSSGLTRLRHTTNVQSVRTSVPRTSTGEVSMPPKQSTTWKHVTRPTTFTRKRPNYTALSQRPIVLDTTPYAAGDRHWWTFRTVYHGHDKARKKDIVSTVRMFDYEVALSIDHGDPLTSPREGIGFEGLSIYSGMRFARLSRRRVLNLMSPVRDRASRATQATQGDTVNSGH